MSCTLRGSLCLTPDLLHSVFGQSAGCSLYQNIILCPLMRDHPSHLTSSPWSNNRGTTILQLFTKYLYLYYISGAISVCLSVCLSVEFFLYTALLRLCLLGRSRNSAARLDGSRSCAYRLLAHLSRRDSAPGPTSLLGPMRHCSETAAPRSTKLAMDIGGPEAISRGCSVFTPLLRPQRSVGVEFHLFYATFAKVEQFSPNPPRLFPRRP